MTGFDDGQLRELETAMDLALIDSIRADIASFHLARLAREDAAMWAWQDRIFDRLADIDCHTLARIVVELLNKPAWRVADRHWSEVHTGDIR